jgi:hypothetical protein
MNARYVAWLVVGAAALPSLALGYDTPTPAPAASSTPAPMVDASTVLPPAAAPAAPVAPPSLDATAPETLTVAAPTTTETTTIPSVPATPAVTVADPVPGDSVATVLTALGKPNGVITLPDKYLMMFDRGNVVMSLQDIVLEVRLTPLAAYTAKLAEQVAEENDRRNASARANALLDLLMNDPGYIAMSTRDRLLALTRFDRDHPGSDAHQDYLDLLAIYAAEQATHAKVVDLQNQAAEARAETIAAQEQAAKVAAQLQFAQQQTVAAQQQAAQASALLAQQQAGYGQQTTVVVGNGPTLRTGAGGIAITGGGNMPFQQSPPPGAPSNHSINNVPPQGLEIVMPDGTIKYIPGNSTSGNHSAYY